MGAAELMSFDAARRHHARGLSYIGATRTGHSQDSRSLFGVSDVKTPAGRGHGWCNAEICIRRSMLVHLPLQICTHSNLLRDRYMQGKSCFKGLSCLVISTAVTSDLEQGYHRQHVLLFYTCSPEEQMLPPLSDLLLAQDIVVFTMYADWRLWRMEPPTR